MITALLTAPEGVIGIWAQASRLLPKLRVVAQFRQEAFSHFPNPYHIPGAANEALMYFREKPKIFPLTKGFPNSFSKHESWHFGHVLDRTIEIIIITCQHEIS